MTTRSGRQYTLPSTVVIPITPINSITPVSPPKWSHKELFGPLDLANTQGGLHDLPKRVDSWIPRFSGEEGSYGNSHWTKFCEGFEFHQSGQEHPDTFMRLFCCRPNTHLGYRGRNLQSTWCVLGGKSRVKVLSPDPQLLRLGQLLAKPRGVVPIKRI
jgi:hypothetical protein